MRFSIYVLSHPPENQVGEVTIKKNLKKQKISALVLTCVISSGIVIGFQNCAPQIAVTDKASKILTSSTEAAVPETAAPGTSVEPVFTPLPPVVANPPAPVNPFAPTTPGVVLLPIEGEWASIAFDDNIVKPEEGDRDFNDAVFNYKIAEQYNGMSQLVRVFIEVRLRSKLSGSNHRLQLSLNGDPTSSYDNITFKSTAAIIGSASYKMTNTNEENRVTRSIPDSILTVLTSTSNRVGEVIKFEITVDQPELNIKSTSNSVDYKKYRFILSNLSHERIGIDIAEINSTDEMLSNRNRYPFGFMIPTDWRPPTEGQLIDKAYPKFRFYHDWLNGEKTSPPPAEAVNWFTN